MHSRTRHFVAFSLGLTLAILPMAGGMVHAQGFSFENTGLQQAGTAAKYNTSIGCTKEAGGCIPQIIGTLISSLLGLFGALFLVLIMYGGVQYMLAGGDSTKVKAATTTLKNAILGMLIVASSYAIASFVISTVGAAATGGNGVANTSPTP